MAAKGRIKTPLLLQMEAVECGAAALGMVLGYYGRFVPLAELRRECGVSRDGSKASNVVKAARRFGLEAKGYSKEVKALREMNLPLIIFWRFNHFLVVEGFSDDEVYLNDPGQGHVTVSAGEFDNGFTGVVLAMEPGPEFQRGGSPPQPLRAIAGRLRRDAWALGFAVLAGLLLVLPSLAASAFTGIFIDTILVERHMEWLRPLLVLMAGTLVLQLGLKLLQLYCLRRLKVALTIRLASQFFWHLLRLPIAFYAQRYPGEIAGRANLNEKLAGTLSGQLITALIDLSTMVFYAAVMAFYDVLLTAIGVTAAVLNFLALRWVAAQRIEANMRLGQETGKVGSVAIAALQNIETVKASGSETTLFAQWAGHYARLSNARAELAESGLTLGVLPTFLQTLTTVLILVVGGLRVIQGEISIGMLVAFQALMTSFLTPISTLVGLGTLLQETRSDVLRLEDVLENPPLEAQRPPAEAEPVRLQGRLEVEGLTFGYSPLAAPLLKDFSLRVQPGQRVAFVGGSGSGKSTLGRLICGLYEPWAGRVLYDGKPRPAWSQAVLSNSVGVVDQDIMLFEGTIRDNLTLWDRTVPEELLVRACQDAAIDGDIRALPGAYDTVLPEGGISLSGGQRQRLEIARALIHNPSLLLLDEATSALDSETERIIVENLRRRGCTCVLVAHRLSTVRDCDEIVVLERGMVVERGTHEELWNAGGAYARLIRQDG